MLDFDVPEVWATRVAAANLPSVFGSSLGGRRGHLVEDVFTKAVHLIVGHFGWKLDDFVAVGTHTKATAHEIMVFIRLYDSGANVEAYGGSSRNRGLFYAFLIAFAPMSNDDGNAVCVGPLGNTPREII